ncbi:hypothetical protein GOOTI_207_00200 [Gordonia otitidis NBRC 100426]|uniref:Uncharacterized protein n=1 Tax=Gordonia otitidis (strain DSM 44809 / CCUG 52243 / JCM 12355 / NBRC 100426 / IFM 10032) TaxID=1108044 RepID=H5TS77_GORO1|nr:hypothetical protein GOOTI_207_00200 [Gordonia otitidis NBRC 100426]
MSAIFLGDSLFNTEHHALWTSDATHREVVIGEHQKPMSYALWHIHRSHNITKRDTPDERPSDDGAPSFDVAKCARRSEFAYLQIPVDAAE